MDFKEIIKYAHCITAYISLTIGILLVLILIAKTVNKNSKTPFLRKLGLFSILTFHLQIVLGIILYLVSVKTQEPLARGFGAAMKVAADRLYVLEHPLMMLFGVILITIGNIKLKKQNTISWGITLFFFFGLVLILSRLPYKEWLGLS